MRTAELVSGAGNLFVLVDAREGVVPSGAEARAWCEAAAGRVGEPADGLLVLQKREDETRLTIWNSDGSLAAACGNGLRCAGWLLLLEAGAEEVVIHTEKGPRGVRGEAREGGAEHLTADLGVVRVEPLAEELALVGPEQAAWRGDAGNPHCVFLVEDLEGAGLKERGAMLQEHPLFSGGVNVGYLAEHDGAWSLRVFERGVGETEACGTGAAAAAHVLHEALGLPFPITIALSGGKLKIERDSRGGASVSGAVEHLGSLSLEPATRAPA